MPHGNPPPHAHTTPSPAPERQSQAVRGSHTALLGLHLLPRAAADLILLGDLTGRYASGSYSRLGSGGQSVVLRSDRQGESEHGHRITAAIACHVARAGGTLGQLTGLLLRPDHEGGRHTRTIEQRSGQARALDYLRRVWGSASTAVGSTVAVVSRQQAHEDLTALRERIETTPWRGERGRTALRVLRAHLNFAEAAGGRRHAASERQTAEEAGISRQTLRNAYEAILKPLGWLQRLRAGHGREGSTWYLANGIAGPDVPSLSRDHSTQFPPGRDLEEWSTPETGTAADVDSTLIGRLMGHDAFAHHGLGSSALMILGALRLRDGQSVRELVATSSVSRATAYRTLHRLAQHGLVIRDDQTWALSPNTTETLTTPTHNTATATATSPPPAVVVPAWSWEQVADFYRTTGTAARRAALHAAERAAYLHALEQRAEHRSKALVAVHDDGRHVLVPAPRGDEPLPQWRTANGALLDPATGHPDPEWRIATDGRLILITPADQLSHDELLTAHAHALTEWENAA